METKIESTPKAQHMTAESALVEATSALKDILTEHPELRETYEDVLTSTQKFLSEHLAPYGVTVKPFELPEV